MSVIKPIEGLIITFREERCSTTISSDSSDCDKAATFPSEAYTRFGANSGSARQREESVTCNGWSHDMSRQADVRIGGLEPTWPGAILGTADLGAAPVDRRLNARSGDLRRVQGDPAAGIASLFPRPSRKLPLHQWLGFWHGSTLAVPTLAACYSVI